MTKMVPGDIHHHIPTSTLSSRAQLDVVGWKPALPGVYTALPPVGVTSV